MSEPTGGAHSRRRFLAAAALGVPGTALLALAGAPAAQGAARSGTTTGSAAGATTGTATVVQAAHATAKPELKLGSTGTYVKQLQRRLKELHYDVGAVDGHFGDDTLHALYAFKKVQRMKVTGTVTPKTWRKLANPRRPKVRYKLSAAAVEVNLTLRILILTKKGKVTRIVDASPGKPSTPTVTGSFRITRRINGWRHSDLGYLWKPNYFHGGYAIHGEGSVPTYAASHGCVRVTISAMNRLWPVLRLTERVHVFHA